MKQFKQIRVSEDMEQETISGVAMGEAGYTVPWAIYQEDGHLWINGGYTIHNTPSGTVQARVTRTKEGIRVERKSLGNDFRVSIGGSDPLPVELY